MMVMISTGNDQFDPTPQQSAVSSRMMDANPFALSLRKTVRLFLTAVSVSQLQADLFGLDRVVRHVRSCEGSWFARQRNLHSPAWLCSSQLSCNLVVVASRRWVLYSGSKAVQKGSNKSASRSDCAIIPARSPSFVPHSFTKCTMLNGKD